MEITDLLGALIGGGVGLFGVWKAHVANRIAKAAERHAAEANRVACEANRLAEKANDIALRANRLSEESIQLEHQPQASVTYTVGTQQSLLGPTVTLVFAVINTGKVPIILQHESYRVNGRPTRTGFSRTIGFNMDDPELPQRLNPGDIYEVVQDIRRTMEVIDEHPGEIFDVVFTDVLGNDFSLGPYNREQFREQLNTFDAMMNGMIETSKDLLTFDLVDDSGQDYDRSTEA